MGKRLETPNSGYSDVIKIRAHHLLCMQGYQGYGYSREFERNLKEVIEYLDSHPYSRLEITAEADVICDKCPYLKDGKCIKSLNSNSITYLDLKVLSKIGIELGKIESTGNIFKLVNESLNSSDLKEICGKCSWKEKCLWYYSKSQD